jgi:hypothetical protein
MLKPEAEHTHAHTHPIKQIEAAGTDLTTGERRYDWRALRPYDRPYADLTKKQPHQSPPATARQPNFSFRCSLTNVLEASGAWDPATCKRAG